MFYRIIFILCLVHSICFSQFLSIDPPVLELEIQDEDNFHTFDNIVEVAVNSDASDWSVVAIAHPLLSESGDIPISEENLFIHHEFTNGEARGNGNGFQPMNNVIFLGNGIQTAGEFKVVNHLSFKFQIPSQFVVSSYHGEIRIQYSDDKGRREEVILNLLIRTKKFLTFRPQFEILDFEKFARPGLHSIPPVYNIHLTSNTNHWNMKFELSPFTGDKRDALEPDILYIRIHHVTPDIDEGAGQGFISMSRPLDISVLLIEKESKNKYKQTLGLEFRLKTSWTHRTGHYRATLKIYSPEDPDNILVIPVEIFIPEVNSLSLSASEVYFHVDGPPAVWQGDKNVKVMVGSNCGDWSVVCDATDLIGKEDRILPRQRLFLRCDPSDFNGDVGAGLGYQSLDKTIKIAEGTKTEPTEVCEMGLKLKTLLTDRPGRYKGTVTIRQLTNP